MGPDYKMQDMDEKENVLSSLLDSVEEYGKTSFELFKLKRLDKASDIAGTVISRLTAIIAYLTFLLMASLGVAFWLGEVMGKIWYGFFVVAAFYGLVGLIVYFFMHKSLKRIFADMIIHNSLK
jgi:phosphoglycerol transferase MdoB-like AlkP superfamily enzyme